MPNDHVLIPSSKDARPNVGGCFPTEIGIVDETEDSRAGPFGFDWTASL